MAKENNKNTTMELDFIICDNTINRYGWRLLVEGIQLDGFLKNPVCCIQHETWNSAVGKWKNLRVEESQLKGTLEFDNEDEDAIKFYKKYKKGIMNAVSLNVIPLVESMEAVDLLPGQKYPTITKSELLEVSLVTVPGQKNAVRDVKLSTPEGHEHKLNLIITEMEKTENNQEIERLNKELQEQKQLNADNLIKLHQNRGVIAEGEIEALKKLALADFESTSKMLEARVVTQKNENEPSKDLAESLVKLHFERGAITAEMKELYVKLAMQDFEGTKKVLEGLKGKEVVANFIGSSNTHGNDERKDWTYLDYFKKDPEALSLIEKEQPEKYKKLCTDFEAKTKKENYGII
ncbi:MAG: HK97 family phage prohead protease [Bacteroidales bacterium]|jgi:HK97 family phage prohead protease|nr:HK97 family phage prohead protease [Bacteroidales bacterium]